MEFQKKIPVACLSDKGWFGVTGPRRVELVIHPGRHVTKMFRPPTRDLLSVFSVPTILIWG